MKIIFLGYVPGSYGSFLYHCLSQSTDCFSMKTESVFNSEGAAHNGVLTCIHNFHDGDDLLMWESLSDKEKEEYIDRYSFFPVQFTITNTYYIHRLCVPRLIPQVQRFFPDKKFVRIVFDDESIPRIAHDMARKTYTGFERKISNKDEKMYDMLNSSSKDAQLEIYSKICVDWVKSMQSNDYMPNVYDFDYRHFLNKDNFIHEIYKLAEYLEIEKPIELDNLYAGFCKENKI